MLIARLMVVLKVYHHRGFAVLAIFEVHEKCVPFVIAPTLFAPYSSTQRNSIWWLGHIILNTLIIRALTLPLP